MKISKEKFNKLKQLDRIECRQKIQLINKRYNYSLSFGFGLLLIIIALLCILISLNTYQMGDRDITIDLAEAGGLIFKLAFLYFFVQIALFFVFAMLGNNKLRKLEEEYFKIEVKKN